MNSKANLLNEITEWNLRYPLDRWWRNKYNIAFRSKAHLDQCQYDIYLEYMEQLLFSSLSEQEIEDKYKPGFGDIFKANHTPDIESLDDLVFNNDGSICLG